MKKIALFAFLLFFCVKLMSQEKLKRWVYKEIDTTRLFMEALYPKESSEKKLPAIIFFFGGGWKGGSIDQFRPQAKYFASRGIIAVLVDYRVASRHNSTPFDAVRDAKSAIKFLRFNAKDLGIHPDKIIAAGGS
ncbi:MAG: alpha/beta hydrolase, partial [Bacteroidota bacterium]